MRGTLTICEKGEYDIHNYEFLSSTNEEFDNYSILVHTDMDKSFEQLFTDEIDLEESLSLEMEMFQDLDEFKKTKKEYEFIKKCCEKGNNLVSEAEYVEFRIPFDQIVEYIKKNPSIKTKKIVFSDDGGMDLKKIEEIKNLLNGKTDIIYFSLQGNHNIITYNQCLETYKSLSAIVDDVNQYNFSPLEKMMYVYDIVRRRVYKDADSDEDLLVARDLTSALLGDKVVCLGYAVILEHILNQLGIKTSTELLYSMTGHGHARNVVLIKDDKYDIEGVYYLDATWDSKEISNDKYAHSYKFFAKTIDYMNILDDGEYISRNIPGYSEDMIGEFNESYNGYGISRDAADLIKTINWMSTFVGDNSTVISYFPTKEGFSFFGHFDLEHFSNKFEKILDLFEREIPADVLLKALYAVKRIQYLNGTEVVPITKNAFINATIISDWNFIGTPEERLSIALYRTVNELVQIINAQYSKYFMDENIEKDMERIKLIKVLKKINK